MAPAKILGAMLWGGAFIVAGVLWLLANFGLISVNVWQLWPLIFVVIGLQIIIDGVFSKQK